MLASVNLSVFANGDPIVSYSSILKTGNPIPRTIADIQLLKENVYIQPLGIYTRIEVTYLLYNHSNTNYNDINYGFPIDYEDDDKNIFISDDFSESIYEIGWNKDNIKDMTFSVDGIALIIQGSSEVIKPYQRLFNVEYDDSVTVNMESRRWFYTHFSIPAQKTVELKISYLQRNSFSSPAYSPYFCRFINDIQRIKYDFSPAFHWGDGTVYDFHVMVDMSVLSKLANTNKGVVFEFNGLDFQKEGNIRTYSCKNFKLKDAPILDLTFQCELPIPGFYEITKQKINNRDFLITCSNTQPRYPISNLTDMDNSTAWVPSGNGIGDSIIIAFDKPQFVSDILLYNGYNKTSNLWQSNSRIKRMTVDIWRPKEKYEVEFSENNEYERFKLAYNKPCVVPITNCWQLLTISEEKIDYRVKKIKLTITEVTPGSKYNDLCLSEIFILSK